MDENYALAWDNSSTVVQEEVICSIENEMLPGETEEFTEEVVEEHPDDSGEIQQEDIVYLTDDNVIVMQPEQEAPFEEEVQEFMDCQVAEEVVAEPWDESCPEEIVVGSEEAVGGSAEQAAEDVDIPLPTHQDEYLASRPHPCDFCSRRFRKKANLMNHMVAHQTDRPHGCNLCGVRYIRRCDLMNHLKIHAYIPETDGLEEEDVQQLEESDVEKTRSKRIKSLSNGRKKVSTGRIKKEYDSSFEQEDAAASSSRSYNYVDEDMRLMEAMESNIKTDYGEYQEYGNAAAGNAENSGGQVEMRYPVTDTRKPFVCQHCGVCFAREKALASHARVHGGDSPFECNKCGDMFWDLALLKEHSRSKHGDIEDFDDDDDDYSEEEATKYGTFYCSSCGLSFHRQDNLKRHQRVHHIKEEYGSMMNEEADQGHTCTVCGDSFSEALDLLAHAEVHARGGVLDHHRCMVCGEPCADEQALADHVHTKHGKNLPPNSCMMCGRTCKDRRTLLKHSWEHSKGKDFICSKCSKTFHNKARLKRHMLSHRNKVVSCDVCGDEFPDGRSLMNHRHSHSSLTGKQFPCRECGKTFGSRSSQQIHIRIHTGERPYGCRYCWKAFADGGTLRKHERIHTGEKPYVCAVCPRAFNQRVVLREHIRSHHSGPDPKYTHSVTPYCCSVCSDMFATSQDLIVHLIHHSDTNTAMNRRPQVGPRKYKRRRKLKQHELDLISNKVEGGGVDEEEEDEEGPIYTDSEDDREFKRRPNRKVRRSSPKPSFSETYPDMYNSTPTAPVMDNVSPPVSAKVVPKPKRKVKIDTQVPSRPKMIHTQKTRVPAEPGEDGKMRHKTKTMVTRTQPTELRSAVGDRIRPRTKNVSYHILNSEKLPLATFPDDDTEQAVNSLLKENSYEEQNHSGVDGAEKADQLRSSDVAGAQTVEADFGPVPTNIIKVTPSPAPIHNLRPSRHNIHQGKVVRIVKSGMLVRSKEKKAEPENILPDIEFVEARSDIQIKQEVIEASPLHELAELSMQHAQNMLKCEMCSAVFADRAQLLDHVPVHI